MGFSYILKVNHKFSKYRGVVQRSLVCFTYFILAHILQKEARIEKYSFYYSSSINAEVSSYIIIPRQVDIKIQLGAVESESG